MQHCNSLTFEHLEATNWHQTLEINLLAPVVINRALLPELKRHRGSIVHIGVYPQPAY